MILDPQAPLSNSSSHQHQPVSIALFTSPQPPLTGRRSLSNLLRS
jgi:hypothetical protein